MNKMIKSLKWRYATKVFDKNKKVNRVDLETIIESFRLSPSSFGLEPWKLIIVENEDLRKELVSHSFNQSQIADASHLLVFTRVTDVNKGHIDKFLDNNVKITGVSREDLSGFENMLNGFFGNMNENSQKLWGHEQVYLALGNVINVLAELRIDSCVIGGFNSEKYDEILGLKEKGLSSVVVLPIGYRDENDKYSNKEKVRFSTEEILEII